MRRRQHLPNPVMPTRTVEDVLIEVKPAAIRELLTAPAQLDSTTTTLIEPMTETDEEPVVQV
jgi:hypothetical protein